MRKRTIALLVLLAALAGAAVSRACLFAMSQITAENVIAYGSLKMELHETDETGSPVPMDGSSVLRLTGAPSQTVKRVITVENVCQEDMYLRMRLSIGGTSADGETFALSGEEAAYAVNTAGGWRRAPEDDGWYYYADILTPGSATAHLLADDDALVFHTEKIARAHPNAELSLSVEVQAVQSVHNPEGRTDVFAARGWPEEVSQP